MGEDFTIKIMKHLYILFLFLTFSAIAQDKTVVMPNGSSIPEWVQLTEIESTLTPGSVIFAGTSGVLSQDASNLFFENSTDRLGVGTNAAGLGTEASVTAVRSINGTSLAIWGANVSTGTSAVNAVRVANNAGNVFDMRVHGTNHSSLPAVGMMLATGSGGLYLSTESTQTIFVSNSGSGNVLARFTNTGVGIAGVTVPSAMLHLPAGTATAGTAPMKLTTGTALTTPSDGALEYHSSHLYFTIGSTRYQLDQQGGGGITNGGGVDEIVKSDGTNLLGTELYSTADGNFRLGENSIAGASRVISTAGSATNIGLYLGGKAEPVFAQNEFAVYDVQNGFVLGQEIGKSIYINADLTNHTIGGGDGDAGNLKDFDIRAADGYNATAAGRSLNLYAGDAFTSGNLDGGGILIQSGTKFGSGVDGNITIDTLTGFLIISTIPTSSAGLPSGAVWANSNVLTIVP